MDNITIRRADRRDISAASAQMAVSYRAAYRGQMTDAYLDSLHDDH